MHALIGDSIEPLPSGGIESAKIGDLQPSEEVLFDVSHRVFHPALHIALADIARAMVKPQCVAKSRYLGLNTGASPRARWSTADLRLSTMTLWGMPPKNSKAC